MRGGKEKNVEKKKGSAAVGETKYKPSKETGQRAELGMKDEGSSTCSRNGRGQVRGGVIAAIQQNRIQSGP